MAAAPAAQACCPPRPVEVAAPRRKRAPRPEVAPPGSRLAPPRRRIALPGQGAARGTFERGRASGRREREAGASGAAAAARGARRRRRAGSGRVPAAPGGGAMDEAVGDLKQALPCVAEAPTVHVEVHQRGGR